MLTSSELTPEGQWKVTSVKNDQEIYPDYVERFFYTFPALVRVVLNHTLNGNLSVNIIPMISCTCADVCPCEQAMVY